MTLIEKMQIIDKPQLQIIKTGSDSTVAKFWENFISPLLPNKDVVISIYQMLLRYINDPDAVFAVRNYGQPQGTKKNYITLRRGFLTITPDYKYFYTDNFFTAYFLKLALDGYVPDYIEFKNAMLSRQFPARFGPFDKKYEGAKAAYSIDGSKGKNPGFGNAGYKISHIVDNGKGYLINDMCMNITEWSTLYGFSRGNYEDYQLHKDDYGVFYARNSTLSSLDAKEVLKAHFLRLTSPFNYILTPKTGKKRCHTFEQGVSIKGGDIGELPELQQYAMNQFRTIYGPIYDDYLSRILLPPNTSDKNTGNFYIGIRYGLGLIQSTPTSSDRKEISSQITNTKEKSKGIGQHAKSIFSNLLTSNKLSNAQIDELRTKEYCRKNLGISFPIIVLIGTDLYDRDRYYKEVINNKYLICSQWYNKNEVHIKNWLVSNELWIE